MLEGSPNRSSSKAQPGRHSSPRSWVLTARRRSPCFCFTGFIKAARRQWPFPVFCTGFAPVDAQRLSSKVHQGARNQLPSRSASSWGLSKRHPDKHALAFPSKLFIPLEVPGFWPQTFPHFDHGSSGRGTFNCMLLKHHQGARSGSPASLNSLRIRPGGAESLDSS